MDHQLGVGVVLVWSNAETRNDLESGRYRFPILVGALLLCHGPGRSWGKSRYGSLATLYLRARGFDACRNLIHMVGENSSRTLLVNAITHKEDHRVIDTGPYGLVRHPIYTGLIAGMLATGVAVGTVTAMLGAMLISVGMWQKARMEEAFLTAELGADAYGSYCRRVPMLIPFLPPHLTPQATVSAARPRDVATSGARRRGTIMRWPTVSGALSES